MDVELVRLTLSSFSPIDRGSLTDSLSEVDAMVPVLTTGISGTLKFLVRRV